jgi:glycosyltransferase involved in cell wall biosynthesis
MVVSALPELEGLVDDRCALTVATRTPGDIAQAIKLLLEDDGLAKNLAEAGWRVFEENFRLEQIAEKMAVLYREVATAECS